MCGVGVAPERAHPGQGRARPERAQRASLARCARVRDSPTAAPMPTASLAGARSSRASLAERYGFKIGFEEDDSYLCGSIEKR